MYRTGALERTVRRRFTRLMQFVPHRVLRAIALYRVDIVGCADEGGASFASDGLRKLSPSYGPKVIPEKEHPIKNLIRRKKMSPRKTRKARTKARFVRAFRVFRGRFFCAGSQAPALVVIHKWLKPVIPAWTAGIQSQGCETAGWHIA